MINKAPWDEVVRFGNPWHGKMAKDGTLTLADGRTKAGDFPKMSGASYVQPGNLIGYTFIADGLLTLVKFDGAPAAPAPSPDEAALGMVWQNYAILASSNRNYSPMANAGLGDNTWLYKTGDSEVWMVRAIAVSNTTLRVSARRLNRLNDPWVILLQHQLPAGSAIMSNGVLLASAPNGKEAIAHVSDATTNVAYVTVTLTAGTADSPPVAAAVTIFGAKRAVTGTLDSNSNWSQEVFAGIRYLIDGTKREIWFGESHELAGETGNGNTETRKVWLSIGGQRTDVWTQVITNSLGSFSGTTNFFGSSYQYQAQSTNDTPVFGFSYAWQRANQGVICVLQNLPGGVEKVVHVGIVANAQKSYDLIWTGGQRPVFCEHPITGQFIDGAAWIF